MFIFYARSLFDNVICDYAFAIVTMIRPSIRLSVTRVGFLPWQKVFLPGQWKKLVKTGKKLSA
jgi:hypothetical protein